MLFSLDLVHFVEIYRDQIFPSYRNFRVSFSVSFAGMASEQKSE